MYSSVLEDDKKAQIHIKRKENRRQVKRSVCERERENVFLNRLGLWNHLVSYYYKLRILTSDIYEIVSFKPCSLTTLKVSSGSLNGPTVRTTTSNCFCLSRVAINPKPRRNPECSVISLDPPPPTIGRPQCVHDPGSTYGRQHRLITRVNELTQAAVNAFSFCESGECSSETDNRGTTTFRTKIYMYTLSCQGDVVPVRGGSHEERRK